MTKIKQQNHAIIMACLNHRRPEGGGNLGQLPPPLKFENDDVICCSRGTLKFSVVPSALAQIPSKLV